MAGRPVPAAEDRVLAAGAELLLLFGRAALRFREMPVADAQVGARVEGAARRQVGGGPQEAEGGAPGARDAHGGGHASGGDRHVGGAGQVGAAVVRDQPRRAERDQAPRRVEDLGGEAVDRVQVPDGVGQHGGHAGAGGELRQPRRAERAVRLQVVHDLDGHLSVLAPAGQCPAGLVPAPGGDRPAHVAGRAEEDDEAGRVLGDQVLRHGRGVGAVVPWPAARA